MSTPSRDRFDTAPRQRGRVGAHRAEQPGLNGWVVLLWSAVAIILLTVAGTFAGLIYTGRIELFPGAQTPGGSGAGVEGVLDTSYSILILNGTGSEGLDALLRDELLNAGWRGEDIYAGASGVTDFAETTVYYVSDADEAAAVGLSDFLGGAMLMQSDFYADADDPGAKQLTVVIGTDRTGTPG